MADLERVQQNTPFTVSQQWYEDGVAADPGSVAVAVLRADGTSVVSGSATGTGTAARTFNLTAVHTALLDTLKITWTSTPKGTLVSYVEVVGGFLFSVAEFRSLGTAYTNVTNYPTSVVTDMRTRVEQALEDACNVAFVPRYTRETAAANGTTLILKWPKVRTIRAASSVTGGITTTLSAGELALLSWDDRGLYGYSWPVGYGNLTVGYEHGWDRPPEMMRQAALLLAKRWITPGAADDRAITLSNDQGTYSLFQAGVRGHQFDVPYVQTAVDQYSMVVGVA